MGLSLLYLHLLPSMIIAFNSLLPLLGIPCRNSTDGEIRLIERGMLWNMFKVEMQLEHFRQQLPRPFFSDSQKEHEGKSNE